MLEHQGRIDWQLRELAQVGRVVHLPGAGYNLAEVHVVLRNPGQVFRVAGYDPSPELRETVLDEVRVAIEAFRGIDAVADVHVDAERRPVHGPDQFQLRVGTVGQAAPHHLDREHGPASVDRV